MFKKNRIQMKKLILLITIAFMLFPACQTVEQPNVVVQLLNQGWKLTGDSLYIFMQVDVPSVVQHRLY